jgi:acylphosphatase
MPARHVLVSGLVQGVGFRYSCRTEALRVGATGWVRNLPDGRVEAVVSGDAADALVAWLRVGPPGSRVDDIEVEDVAEPEGLEGFEVRGS